MRTKQGSYPADAPAQAARLKEDAPKPAGRPSSLVDTRVIYCGDCLDQLRKLPDACVDLIYIDPPFNSNRNYEVFWGETKEKRAFADRHASTQAYIEFMRPRCVEMEDKTGGFSRAHKRSCKERSSCRFGALDGTTGAKAKATPKPP
jgi:hypothetical protein